LKIAVDGHIRNAFDGAQAVEDGALAAPALHVLDFYLHFCCHSQTLSQ